MTTPFNPIQDANDRLPLRRAMEQSSIFGDLSEELLFDLSNCMKILAIKGGERILTQGKAANSLLIVISGRLLAVRRHEDGTTQRLGEISPGSTVGEVGLVLNQPRTADVLAIRDSSVAQLYREDFEQLLQIHPIELNRAIARKIFEYSAIQPGKPPTSGGTPFALVPLDESVDIRQFCLDFKRTLQYYGSVCHIDADAGQSFHHDDDATLASNRKLGEQEQSYDFLLYEATAECNPWSHLTVRQADKIIFIAGPDTDPHSIDLSRPQFSGPGFEMVHKSLVVLHPPIAAKPKVNLAWHDVLDLHRIYPVRQSNKQDIARLGRFMTDNAVGLVLGGGGARGFAHVGVLKALFEEKIPVDMICGNSMGALIAAQYANGTPIDQLTDITKAFAKGGERPTIPVHSIFGGNRVRRDIIKMFGDTNIHELWLQTFMVSCNLSNASIHVHDTGPLWEAVLASNSPAAVAPPVIHNGDLLVDAALLDNVPVESMRQKLGFGTVIAVDVDVKNELRVSPTVKTVNPWKLLWQKLFVRNRKYIPSIFDILDRSGHLGGLMRRESSKAMADFYLQPPVSEFSLMGYGKGDKIAEKGYQYTKDAILKWREGKNPT